jgi:ABC-type oligopeptide transport system substrate-binding subunit
MQEREERKMNHKKFYTLLAVILLASMVLAACAPAATKHLLKKSW